MFFVGRKDLYDKLNNSEILYFDNMDDLSAYLEEHDVFSDIVIIDACTDQLTDFAETKYFILYHSSQYNLKYIIVVESLTETIKAEFKELNIKTVAEQTETEKIIKWIHKYPEKDEENIHDLFGDLFKENNSATETEETPQQIQQEIPQQIQETIEVEIIEEQSETLQQPIRELQQTTKKPYEEEIIDISQFVNIKINNQEKTKKQFQQNTIEVLKETSQPTKKEPIKQITKRQQHTYIPTSKKKIICLTGHGDTGTTTVALLLGELLSKSNSVAIVDMNSNKDLYEIKLFGNNQLSLMESSTSLSDLYYNNEKKPYMINKHLHLYTCPYTDNLEISNAVELIYRLEPDYDVIIVDGDFDLDKTLLSYCTNLFIVTDVEPTNIKYTSNYLYNLSKFINTSKISIILNKYIESDVSDRDFVKALCCFVDFKTERSYMFLDKIPNYFKIEFSEEIIRESLYSNISVKTLSKRLKKSFETIMNII